MKNLSPIQQKVIDALKATDGNYIYKSPYYNHNRVNQMKPYIHEHGFTTHEVMQFSRTTFEVLLREGLIVQFSDNKNVYILT